MVRFPRPLSFGMYLAGLIAVALIPVLVLAVAVVAQGVALRRHELRSVLRGNARAVASVLDDRLADGIAALTALTGSPRMRSGEFGLFDAEARVLLAGYGRWQSVTLVSATGSRLAVVRSPVARSSSAEAVARPATWQRIPDQAIVSAVPLPSLDGTTEVEVGVPIARGGQRVGALWARLSPDCLRTALMAHSIRPQWTAAIIGTDGIVLATNDTALVGQRFPYDGWRDVHPGTPIATQVRTAGGKRAYVAFDRLTVAPWTVAYVAPISGEVAPPLPTSSWTVTVTGAVVVPLLAVGLAGGFLRRRVHELAGAAAAVSHDGPMPAQRPTGVREIDAAHAALREARQALAERAADRDRLHEAEVSLLQSQRAEAISHLASAIAHDFGNLALAISGQLELVRRRLGDQPQVTDLIEPALRLTLEAGRMMSDLTTAVRTRTAAPQPAQLNQVLRDAAALLRQAAGRGVRTEFSLQPDLWLCTINHTMLKSAVFNLVINAKAAMPAGGRLWIQTCNTTVPADTTGAEEPPAGEYVMLVVSDTGAGISPETLDRIFDPFFTTRRDDNGTGLGLAVVRDFVMHAAGHIRVTSQPGAGTTFFLYFPRRTEAPAGPSQTGCGAASTCSGIVPT